ncbi:DNA phosphorothioation-associated putative methyltransferase [Amycolatopsis jejuensis]|uniref:DNA phosphorothioation-associated putative methyltransferase n=1 Tax=Amycolatopsis jejuensis TaxID=330084 RepID=UPI000526F56A|nr:DNA phosphorothioation-associated putative methyltransferase [Amycolatopsis jejuensis]
MTAAVPRHRTALIRTKLSRPLACAVADKIVTTESTVFDYGCGRGTDLAHLNQLGITSAGWDPAHRPHEARQPAQVVNLGYVLNVIEHPDERVRTLHAAWELARDALIVSARMTWDARGLRGRPSGDGVLTSTGTFQKFFDQHELRTLVQDALNAPTLNAAPGIIYVFRNPTRAQELLAARTHRRTAVPEPWICGQLYDQHRDTLMPLVEFLTAYGRLPRSTEMDTAPTITRRFGSLARAFAIISTSTDPEHWVRLRARATASLLVHLALARFDGRPRYGHLPRTVQHDVREFTQNYRNACRRADRLLMASGNADMVGFAVDASPVGKRSPTALYIHVDALRHAPAVLRVLEGCARTLVGNVPGANIIKLHRNEPKVAYLTYPTFGQDSHPTLATALSVDLRTRVVDVQDHRGSPDPPLLHRTEEFLGPDDPRRERLSAISVTETEAGLYDHPERIATLGGWQRERDRLRRRS